MGPISYLEIEAYKRQSLNNLSPWSVRLIRSMDDAVRGVISAQKPKPQGKAEAEPEAIPVTDTKAIRSLFAGLKTRKAKPKGDAHG